MEHKYRPHEIESKWQDYWRAQNIFATGEDRNRPKYYVLDMFPYPSGTGLHVGHPEGYTATDIIARYKRMNGFNVLHPMGWDAFGLPAERAAVRENRHPADITKENTANFKRQIDRIGLSYDWDRVVDTSSPEYYRWTQWIFLKLYEKNMAYLAEVPVNWCAAQGTVLANEEVQDGKYVETGDPVERRTMRQWMLRITSYAQRLLDDLDELDWPTGIIEMQRQWIGRSEGANVRFPIEKSTHYLDVFTTRPDTLFGVTFCAVAPEHPLLDVITTEDNRAAVQDYIKKVKNISDLDRETAKDKTGIFTGAYARNPLNDALVPIWVADYIKIDYGSGAIMAVPAHDERDYQFAKKFGLKIVEVISGGDIAKQPHTGDGTLVNSGFLSGMKSDQAKTAAIDWLEENKKGERKVTYKLRDWLFSRQRYWGEPFPILHGPEGEIIPVPVDTLPITLPKLTEYKPTADGQPPLARAQDWMNVPLNGKAFLRETNTMPQWAGSCWYYLRFMDPQNDKMPFDPEAEKYWGPVDLYVGGVEHAVLHLLYARFWHKVLYDCGLVHTKEPFKKLFNQGMILGISYKDEKGKYYGPQDVENRSGTFYVTGSGTPLSTREEKMSKSKLNVVNPDDIVNEYGADSLRLYEMFMGPLEAVKPWQMNGVKGVYNFLERAWSLLIDIKTGELNPAVKDVPEDQASEPLLRELNATIHKVTANIEDLRFNTAIARMMEFVNAAKKEDGIPRSVAEKFVKILSPFAPHIAEEIWEKLSHRQSISHQTWPLVDEKYLQSNCFVISVHFNGKKRSLVTVGEGMTETEVQELARGQEETQRYFNSGQIKRVVYVPNKMINFIVG